MPTKPSKFARSVMYVLAGYFVAGCVACADDKPHPESPPKEIRWLGVTDDWMDSNNWEGGKVPDKDDLALFDTKPQAQPRLDVIAEVAGLIFRNVANETPVDLPGTKGGKLKKDLKVAFHITGTGRLKIGAAGIDLNNVQLISVDLELTHDQSWLLGFHEWNPNLYQLWIDVISINRHMLIVQGDIAGNVNLIKTGAGKCFYIRNSAPSLAGDVTIDEGSLVWALVGLEKPDKYFFGQGTLYLNGGFFTFGAAASTKEDAIPQLANRVVIGSKGGRLMFDQEGTPPMITPTTIFAGDIELGGPLCVAHTTSGSTGLSPDITGNVLLPHDRPAVPGLNSSDISSCMGCLNVYGSLRNAPTAAVKCYVNPVVMRSYGRPLILFSPNEYSSPTLIDFCSSDGFSLVSHSGLVHVMPESNLTGPITLLPGGRLSLSRASNLEDGCEVSLKSNPLALSVLSLGYKGLPRLSSTSDGVLTVDIPDFDTVSDLSKLGNGHMLLGARDKSTFTGRRLLPGAGNVYRFGGGTFGGILSTVGRGWSKSTSVLTSGGDPGSFIHPKNWLRSPAICNSEANLGGFLGSGLLEIRHGVLVGDASVEIGSLQRLGNIAVRLLGNNTFSGDLTVQGPNSHGFVFGLSGRGSILQGVAPTTAGKTPFGSANGKVVLHGSTIHLTAVPDAKPVAKGVLEFTGLSTVALDANIDNTAQLSFASLVRKDRAVFAIDPLQERLGDKERLLITDWKEDRALVDPWALYVSTHRWIGNWGPKGYEHDPQETTGPDFLAYDASGGRGFLRFTNYVEDAMVVKAGDVLKIGGIELAEGAVTVRALRVTQNVTGTARLRVNPTGRVAGVILGADFAPDLDFGTSEGIIYATDLSKNRTPAQTIHKLTGKVSGQNGITVLGGPLVWGYDWIMPAQDALGLMNINNDFSGPITVVGGALKVVFDAENDGSFTQGALGNLDNPIYLDGGYFVRDQDADGPGAKNAVLAPSRTLYLGTQGGWLHGVSTIRARITGPGGLFQCVEGAGRHVITNPDNDYSGGTWVSSEKNEGMVVTPEGKLGTGPVQISPEAELLLMGDANLHPNATLTIAQSGCVALGSANPHIGYLEGSGWLFLGITDDAHRSPPNTPKPVQQDKIDLVLKGGTFYGAIRESAGEAVFVAQNEPEKGVGSLTILEELTLYGNHSFRGLTTVQGRLNLYGGLTGDVVLKVVAGKAAPVISGSGLIGGSLDCRQGVLAVKLDGAQHQPLTVNGTAIQGSQLDVEVTDGFQPVAGQKWLVLQAEGGITGKLPTVPKGYDLRLADNNRSLELIRK